jgi:hypothetical protein
MPRISLLPVLLLLAFPAAAGLVAGPEQQITPAAADVAALDQTQGRIASDGDGFLVVFMDASNIDAIRVSAERRRIDERPLVVAGSEHYEVDPDVAFGRDRYFVIWRSETGLYGRMVARDGTMEPAITLSADIGTAPRVAFNGEVFLVVWNNHESTTAHGAIVSPDGVVEKTFVIGPAAWIPKVAAAAGAFFVATSANDLSLTRVERDGTQGQPLVLARDAQLWSYEVASQGEEVVVAWNPAGDAAPPAIDGVVVSATRLTDPQPFTSGPGLLRALVSDPDGAVVVYGRDHDYARRVGSDEPRLLAQSGVTGGASSGSDVVLVTEVREWNADLYVQAVARPEVELLTVAAPYQYWPEIAATNDTALVVWTEWVAPQRRFAMLAKSVGPAGESTPVELPAAVPNLRRVATNGSQFLVTWFEDYAIRGARLTLAGELIDRQSFLIAPGVFSGHDVAWNGTTYVVAFSRGIASKFNVSANIYAVPVSAEGTVGSEIEVSTKGNVQAPAIAGTGGQTAIVWGRESLGRTLEGALLTSGGTVVPLAFPALGLTGFPDVAAGSDSFVVAGQFATAVRWFRVNGSGVVTEPPDTAAVPLWEPLYWQRSIGLTPFGDRFLLLVDGRAAILDPRGWSGALAEVAPDRNARVSGSFVTYARATDPAWQAITRVFVRRLTVTADAPRRRSVH